MPYKFGANVSNLMLMPKKTGGGDHYNFIFFLNHVLRKSGRTPENLRGEPLAFSQRTKQRYNDFMHTFSFSFHA
jgi:hypothetical protein